MERKTRKLNEKFREEKKELIARYVAERQSDYSVSENAGSEEC